MSGFWSIGGDLNTARYCLAGAGTQTAGLCCGGSTGNSSAITEEYDGTSWSAGGNLNTARYSLAGAGTQTAGLCFGGYSGAGYSAVTEEYYEGSNVQKSRQAVYRVLQSMSAVSASRQAVYAVSHLVPIPTNFIRMSVAGQKNPMFSWNFSGQTKYQLQIDDYVSGSVVYDSGEVVSSAQTKLLAWADRLPPGTYYAYLWCWDAYGQKSEAAVI